MAGGSGNMVSREWKGRGDSGDEAGHLERGLIKGANPEEAYEG